MLVVFSLLLAFVASGQAATNATIFEAMNSSEIHTTLTSLVIQFGLDEALNDPNASLTVLAPTDDAFGKIANDTLQCLLKGYNNDTLVNILKDHVAAGEYNSTEFAAEGSIEMLDGNMVMYANVSDLGFTQPNLTNVYLDNGILHSIDGVITYNYADELRTVKDIIDEKDLDNFYELVQNSSASQTLMSVLSGCNDTTFPDGYTVFVPTETAIETFLAEAGEVSAEEISDLLGYHIASSLIQNKTEAGPTEMFNGESVDLSALMCASATTDCPTRLLNAYVYVIKNVIVPGSDSSSTGAGTTGALTTGSTDDSSTGSVKVTILVALVTFIGSLSSLL